MSCSLSHLGSPFPGPCRLPVHGLVHKRTLKCGFHDPPERPQNAPYAGHMGPFPGCPDGDQAERGLRLLEGEGTVFWESVFSRAPKRWESPR